MKRVKHIVFWLMVIGVILLLFSNYVIADVSKRQCDEPVNIIKDNPAMS